jgi:uncharacterized protein YggL (DUF469 family)
MACESVIVFPVRYRIVSGLSTQDRNAVIEAFITEAIEGNDLQFGGGGGGDWQSGIAEPHSTNAATEAQCRAVVAWLQQHPWVVEFAVGPLGDGEEAEPGAAADGGGMTAFPGS